MTPRARKAIPEQDSPPANERTPTQRALDYAKQIIRNYEADVKAGAWTGVNLEAVGFCQGEIYKDALATIDKIASGELTVYGTPNA